MQALLLFSVLAILGGLVFSVVGVPLALSLMPVLLVIGLLRPDETPAAVERGVQPAEDRDERAKPFEWAPPLGPPIFL